jgi:membrane fusion protein (multidrug efflux system)
MMSSEARVPQPAAEAAPIAPAAEPAKPPASPQSPHPQPRGNKRIIIAGAVALVVLVIAVPWVLHSMRTVSTDDAYVNSYVTFVAPRIIGQVARVLVDDNNRVRKGDLLVELDSEPYRAQAAIKQAAVDAAQADLVVAEASVRSQIGQTRGLRFKLQHAIEDVDNQVALLRARAATLEQGKAALNLAQTEFDRAKKLRETKVTSPGGV